MSNPDQRVPASLNEDGSHPQYLEGDVIPPSDMPPTYSDVLRLQNAPSYQPYLPSMSLPGSSELPIMANYGPHPGYPNGPTIDPATHNLLHGPFPYPPSERICYCPGCSQSRGSADYPQFQDTVAVRAPSQYTQDFAQPFPGMLLHYGYGNESYGYGNETYGAWGPDAMAETFVPPMGPGEYMPLDHSYTSGSYPAPYFPEQTAQSSQRDSTESHSDTVIISPIFVKRVVMEAAGDQESLADRLTSDLEGGSEETTAPETPKPKEEDQESTKA